MIPRQFRLRDLLVVLFIVACLIALASQILAACRGPGVIPRPDFKLRAPNS